MSIHPLSLLSHLLKNFELSCYWQWQSTPLLSSFISQKALNSLIISKLKILSSHLASNGDPPPPPPLSTFSKLKVLLIFLFLLAISTTMIDVPFLL